MTGRRLPDGTGSGWSPGDFWKWKDEDRWVAITPTGLMCGLKNHTVTEHEDGTITVSPSILITQGELSWHGFLERGVWRAC
jgi:uncharacterized protein DUF6527